MRSFRTERLLS